MSKQRKIAADQNAIIDTQNTIMQGQREAADKQTAHTQVVERAYVTITHDPPGIQPATERQAGEPAQWTHHLSLRMRVTNHGNTPARITGCLVQLVLTNGELPATPNYDPDLFRASDVSLVQSDSFSINIPYEFKATGDRSFSAAFRQMAEAGHRLYVLAYVDYIDRFGERHRWGYARTYDAALDDKTRPDYKTAVAREGAPVPRSAGLFWDKIFDQTLYDNRNNLVFVMNPGYNYDRPRVRGEGNDWDEEQPDGQREKQRPAPGPRG